MEINLNILFIVAIVIFILYEYFNQNKTTENFADTTTAVTSDQVKQMIREIYLADIDAIRNLSNVATKLSTGGYTTPGNLTVSGTTNSSAINSGQIIVKGKDGNSVILNPNSTDQDKMKVFAGSNGNPPYLFYNKDGTLGSWNGTKAPWSITSNGVINADGELNIKGKILTADGHTIQSAGRQHIFGEELLYLLNKSGVIIGKDWGGNGNLQVQGNISTGGNLTIGNTQITEDILKRVINQKKYAGFAINGSGTTMPLYEGDWLLSGGENFDAWTNDRWDAIFINRGWRITCWRHGIGSDEIGKGTNTTSDVPKKLDVTNDVISSYRAEWIGY